MPLTRLFFDAAKFAHRSTSLTKHSPEAVWSSKISVLQASFAGKVVNKWSSGNKW